MDPGQRYGLGCQRFSHSENHNSVSVSMPPCQRTRENHEPSKRRKRCSMQRDAASRKPAARGGISEDEMTGPRPKS
ncbi:unnamed protein product [Urochloa humidicola]